MEIDANEVAFPFEMSGNCWDSQKRELKVKHSGLTDADLSFEPGKETELLARITSRLNENLTEGHYMVYFCG